jgi:hypothetical protein
MPLPLSLEEKINTIYINDLDFFTNRQTALYNSVLYVPSCLKQETQGVNYLAFSFLLCFLG